MRNEIIRKSVGNQSTGAVDYFSMKPRESRQPLILSGTKKIAQVEKIIEKFSPNQIMDLGGFLGPGSFLETKNAKKILVKSNLGTCLLLVLWSKNQNNTYNVAASHIFLPYEKFKKEEAKGKSQSKAKFSKDAIFYSANFLRKFTKEFEAVFFGTNYLNIGKENIKFTKYYINKFNQESSKGHSINLALGLENPSNVASRYVYFILDEKGPSAYVSTGVNSTKWANEFQYFSIVHR